MTASHEPNNPALPWIWMKVRYTGSDPTPRCSARTKLTQKVLAYHRVHSPTFVVSNHGHPRRHRLRFNYRHS
jgi:hypothetical protein